MVEVKPRAEDLALVADWMVQGKLQSEIDATFPVKDMTQAIQRQRERKNGRVMIKVQGGWD